MRSEPAKGKHLLAQRCIGLGGLPEKYCDCRLFYNVRTKTQRTLSHPVQLTAIFPKRWIVLLFQLVIVINSSLLADDGKSRRVGPTARRGVIPIYR